MEISVSARYEAMRQVVPALRARGENDRANELADEMQRLEVAHPELLALVPPPPPPPLVEPPSPPPPPFERVRVLVDPAEPRVTAETIIAMNQRGGVFQRGGKLVEPQLVPAPKAKNRKGIKRDADTWQIVEANNARVRALAGLSCRYHKTEKDYATGQPKDYDVHVPEWLPGQVLAARDWPFSTLTGIADAPTLRPDGTLITAPGFDSSTGIFLASTLRVKVPDAPTLADAKRAADLLLNVICDFDVGNAGKSAWLAGVLSVAARAVVDGPVPLIAVDASMPGSGKSKLVDAASIITTGRKASRMAYSASDEETDKRITSLGLAGDTFVLIDNVAGRLGCPSLDAALTSTSYRGRVLGKLEMTAAMPMQIVFWATGNGMEIGADLSRRMIMIRLEPQCEHPEDREGPRPGQKWRHPDLLGYVAEHRAELLSAALTIVRAFLVSGATVRLKAMGSYEEWSETIRGAIVWCGLADPIETVNDVRSSDLKAEVRRNVIRRWPVDDGVAVTAKDLIELANVPLMEAAENDAAREKLRLARRARREAWRSILLEWCPPKRGEEMPTATALGYALRKLKGVVVGTQKIDAGEKTEDGVAWSRISIEPAAALTSVA